MPAKVSRRLVIDASVVQSSGGEDAVYPLPKQCRDFLKDTLSCGHRVVLPPPVNAEWKKHESRFARKWLASMFAHRKVVLDDVAEDPALRDAIERSTKSERDRVAMVKDAHLIEAAQVSDSTVVSLDETVRRLFSAASKSVRSLRPVVWANPGHQAEKCSAWLADGAPPEGHRQLGAWRPAT